MAERKRLDVASVQIAARIPIDLHKRVRLYCTTQDISLQAFVERCLRAGLEVTRDRAQALSA